MKKAEVASVVPENVLPKWVLAFKKMVDEARAAS
jgi:hypothetical protein